MAHTATVILDFGLQGEAMKLRRSVSFWTACMLLFYAAHTFAADWTLIADKVAKSVVFIHVEGGSCTGFIINPAWGEKKDRDLVLTAAHCFGAGLYVDQEPAKIVSMDKAKDLLVLDIEDTGRPALKLSKANAKQGESVASLGFGYGFERPMLRLMTIADDNTYIPEDGIGGPLMVTDSAFVSGMSGGPCVNAAGEVVMIVQRASGTVGLGFGADVIKAKTGKYWAKDEAKP